MRNINPALIGVFDTLLAPVNGPPAFDVHNPMQVFIQTMMSCVGVKEDPQNHGRLVELFQETIGKAEDEPWCMALVQSAIAYAEYKTGVKSSVYPSESCLNVFHTSTLSKVSSPMIGDLVIWRHADGASGHVGMIIGLFHNFKGVVTGYRTVEGNTSNGSEITREGDGCYIRIRASGGVGKMKEMGFIRPFPFANPSIV